MVNSDPFDYASIFVTTGSGSLTISSVTYGETDYLLWHALVLYTISVICRQPVIHNLQLLFLTQHYRDCIRKLRLWNIGELNPIGVPVSKCTCWHISAFVVACQSVVSHVPLHNRKTYTESSKFSRTYLSYLRITCGQMLWPSSRKGQRKFLDLY